LALAARALIRTGSVRAIGPGSKAALIAANTPPPLPATGPAGSIPVPHPVLVPQALALETARARALAVRCGLPAGQAERGSAERRDGS
jgi:hypothetical protein